MAEDVALLELGCRGSEEFKYLGSLIEVHGEMTEEANCRIAQASKVFGEVCNSVFLACDLSLETKRLVYQSVVLGIPLHGGEK